MTLKELQSQLSGLEPYASKDDSALKKQAESMYKPQYESDLNAIRDAITSSVADQNRSALSKGMQRSSYASAQEGLIRGQGLKAQQQLATNYQTNVATALQSLLDNEYNRKTSADQYRNQLLMSLYSYGKSGGGSSSSSSASGLNGTLNQTVNSGTRDINQLLQSVVGAGAASGANAAANNSGISLNAAVKAGYTPAKRADAKATFFDDYYSGLRGAYK